MLAAGPTSRKLGHFFEIEIWVERTPKLNAFWGKSRRSNFERPFTLQNQPVWPRLPVKTRFR